MTSPGDNPAVRADKWLWAARFFKTRALAIQAISGGKVHLAGQRIKPARKLQIGDRLTVTKGSYSFAITVVALSLQRGPAEVARTLYHESDESVQQRRELQQARKLEGGSARQHTRRPDKRGRRQIHRFKSGQADS